MCRTETGRKVKPSVKFGRVVRDVIAQPVVLQPPPQWLGRVEHRRPGRQGFQAQAVCEVAREPTNRVALVHGTLAGTTAATLVEVRSLSPRRARPMREVPDTHMSAPVN